MSAQLQADEMRRQHPDSDLLPAGEEEMEEEELEEEEEEEDFDEDQVEEEVYESSSPSTTTSTLTWITWFCSLPGHEYFCEVAEDFIEDDFNLTGLSSLVPFYKEAMEMILDVEPEEESHRVPDVSITESSAELLYGLIHQRYIITRQGLQQMHAKFEAAHFGQCPRVYCAQMKLVPCGRSDLPGVDTVKLYCPLCVDMYVPPSSRFMGVDGAFFGTTFPHLLFQTYPSSFTLQPPAQPTTQNHGPTTPATSLTKVYIPRIYGFRVSERAKSGPRMQWLRMRPRLDGEIDWPDASGPGDSQEDEEEDRTQGGPRERGALYDQEDEDDEDEEEESEEEEEADAQGAAAPLGMTGVVGSPPAKETAALQLNSREPIVGRVVKGLPSPRRSTHGSTGPDVTESVAREFGATKLSLEQPREQAVAV